MRMGNHTTSCRNSACFNAPTAAVVLVTYNVIEAEQALDRVAIIRSGKVLSTGTPSELKAMVSDQVRLELLFRPDCEEVDIEALTGGF
jgi:ABC-2 type transport system ATP-binding protein